MIYDCFSFFNELELLEMRLNILGDIVDRFVLVEATRTHTNQPKPLFFQENAKRFEPFLHKIEHVVVDDYPDFETAWTFENHQRNCIDRGLQKCDPDDTILISDIDEIPDPQTVLAHRSAPGILAFEQMMHYYYLNHFCILRPVWLGTRMLSYRDFKDALDSVRNYGNCCIEKLNRGTTATKIRLYKKAKPVPHGGWHFSFLGGIERVRAKALAYAHEENNFDAYTDLHNIEKRMRNDFTAHRLLGVELDEQYPPYIREHQERYPHLIGPLTPKDVAERVRKTAWIRSGLDRAARLSVQILAGVIPVKKWRKTARTYLSVILYGTAR